MRFALALALAAGLLAPCRGLCAEDPDVTFEMQFGSEAHRLSHTYKPEANAAFAAKLLKAAASAGDNPPLQVLLAEKAYQFGLRASGDYPTSTMALTILERQAPARKLEWMQKKVQLLKLRGGGSVADTGRAGEYLDSLAAFAQESIRAGRLQDAQAAYATAATVARRLDSPRKEEIAAASQWVVAAIAQKYKTDTLKAAVAKNPADMASRKALVLTLTAELDTPGEAAKFLTNDMDEALRTFVTLAGQDPAALPAQSALELGHWYGRTLLKTASPSGKPVVLRRARTYYQQFLGADVVHDTTWLATTDALAAVNKQLAVVPAEVKPASAAAAAANAVNLARGLVLYYPFERIDRGTVPDAGPRGNAAQAHGVQLVRDGRIGRAAAFAGRRDYLLVPDRGSLNPTGAITLATWLRVSTWEGSPRILQKGLHDNQYRLVKDTALRFQLTGVSGGEISCPAPAAGGWHHVAGVYDGKTVRIYVDGQQTASTGASGYIATSSAPLYIGARNSEGLREESFRGSLDDLRIYNRALTAQEVAALAMTTPGPDTSPATSTIARNP